MLYSHLHVLGYSPQCHTAALLSMPCSQVQGPSQLTAECHVHSRHNLVQVGPQFLPAHSVCACKTLLLTCARYTG